MFGSSSWNSEEDIRVGGDDFVHFVRDAGRCRTEEACGFREEARCWTNGRLNETGSDDSRLNAVPSAARAMARTRRIRIEPEVGTECIKTQGGTHPC